MSIVDAYTPPTIDLTTVERWTPARIARHGRLVALVGAGVVVGGILGTAAALFSMTRGGDGPEFPY